MTLTNLEDLPELVMDKITSFLSHRQLLTLEQVSRKLKRAVDTHFSITDHLIIGSLPKVYHRYDEQDDEATAKDKKCFDGFHELIKRCGIRLRTIQITVKEQVCSDLDRLCNYILYFKHIFASKEISDNCPNVENIIASSNMNSDIYMLQEQKVLLHSTVTEIYANNIKTYTGESCKLRGLSLVPSFDHSPSEDDEHHAYERSLNLYSNLERIAVLNVNKNFYKFLPQFIENGLKDLNIFSWSNVRDAKTYFSIAKNLRTLHLVLGIRTEDVADLNKLHLPKNVKLTIAGDVNDCLPQLSENVCNSIIKSINTYIDSSLLPKLKNVQEFGFRNLEQLHVIAEKSFPELKRITTPSSLDGSETYFTQFLTKKGNQLTVIEMSFSNGGISIDVVWKAFKHCKAAKSARFKNVYFDLPIPVTAEDMKAICHMPNLQHFVFIALWRLEDETSSQLRELMETTVKEHLDFQFEYKIKTRYQKLEETYSLCRIRF